MAKLRHARRRTLAVTLIGTCVTIGLVLSASIGAQASHPASVTAEQHWDLLSETAADLTVSKSFEIERGALPGGTTKFSPQPSVTFEVVGRYQSGVSGTSYRVELIGDFNTLASVTFTNTDSGGTGYVRKSASLTWPSADVELDEIQVVKSGSGGGNFDLRKASLALSQQGVIKKTVARVPLAAKYLNPTNTQAQLVDVPAFYEHVSADFSPSPTIKLRATGAGNQATEFQVELWKQGAASAISGSGLSFTSNALTSKETGNLTLSNGVYEVRVKIVDLGPGGQAIEPNAPGLYSAELVIEQSTADSHGLTCTVGIYTGISAAVEYNSNDQDLGFPFKVPSLHAPTLTNEWQWSAKRTQGSGKISVAPRVTGATTTPIPTLVEASFNLRKEPIAAPPASPQQTDNYESRGRVTDGSATALASMSRMRTKVCLRDLIAPIIPSVNVTANRFFSPDGQGDPSRENVSFTATVTEEFSFPVSFQYTIQTLGGQVKKTFPSGSLTSSGQSTGTHTWNGIPDGGGARVADGTYKIVLSATDAAGNIVSNALQQITLDTTLPVVNTPTATQMYFSPNADGIKDTTTINGSYSDLNGPPTWRLAIKNASGTEIQDWSDSHPTTTSKVWDGKHYSGQIFDGTYSAVLKVTDAAGNFLESTLPGIVVDRVKPTLSAWSRSLPAISPNGDGTKESTTISATLGGETGTISWSIPITSGGNTVRTFSGTGTSISEVWDGRNTGGSVVSDATYNATLTATDLAGNSQVPGPLSIMVDTTLPHLANFSATHSAFSPNADGVKETTSISGSIEDASFPVNWSLKIKQGSTVVRDLASGTTSGVSALWDGKDSAGSVVSDGSYSVEVSATDDAGLSRTATPITLIVDKLAPTISGIGVSQTPFSPNLNGVKDTTTVNATLGDANGPISYSIAFKNSGNAIVRTVSDSGSSVAQIWDGKNDAGSVQADGTYTATLTATDAAGNPTAATPLSIVIDTVAPLITDLAASTTPFSPNGDAVKDTTTFSAALSEANGPIDWDLEINAGGPVLKTFSGNGTSLSQLWDGKSSGGQTLASGTYTSKLTVEDLAGNTRFGSIPVVVDLNAPTIASLSGSNMFFSPNGDGSKDNSTVTASLGDASLPLGWTVEIKQGATSIRTLSGTGSSVSAFWDGRNDSGQVVADGSYSAVLNATDTQSLSSSATINGIVVDKVFPTLSNQAVSEPVFSPNNDNMRDTTTVSVGLTDSNTPLTWSVSFRNASNGLMKTVSGSGGSVSAQWDGRSGLQVQPDGLYTANITGADPAGNAVTPPPVEIRLDNSAPTIADLEVSEDYFSPNGDGAQDETIITSTMSDASAIAWEVRIERDAQLVRSYAGSGSSVQQAWDGFNQANEVAQDGGYAVLMIATDSAANASTLSRSIVLDTLNPALTPVTPLDGANVQSSLLNPPLVLDVADDLSLLNSSSLQVTLQDATAGTGPVVRPSVLSEGEIRSAGLALAVGHRYIAEVTLADIAGNVAVEVVNFSSVQLSVPGGAAGGPTATIPPTATTEAVSSGSTKTFTFRSVPLRLSSYEATLQGEPMHPGFGYVHQTVDLTQARIRLFSSSPLGEVELPTSPVAAPSTWGSRLTAAQVGILDSVSTQTVPVVQVELGIPELSFSAPAVVTRAVIEMTSGNSIASVPLCGDPTGACAATQYPTVDPTPFHMNALEAEMLLDGWNEFKRWVASDYLKVPACPTGGPDPCATPALSDYAPALIHIAALDPLAHDWALAAPVTPANDAIWEGLDYGGFPLVAPSVFEPLCDSLLLCSKTEADERAGTGSTNNRDDGASETYCIGADGSRREDKCAQYVYMWVDEFNPHREDSEICDYLDIVACTSSQYHYFFGEMMATLGFHDADRDEFLVGADTGMFPGDGRVFGAVTSPEGFVDPIQAHRQYRKFVQTYDENGRQFCETRLGNSVSDRNEWQQGGDWQAYSGMFHENLLQWTERMGSHPWCTGRLFHSPDYLYNVRMAGLFYSDYYRGDNQSRLAAVYGHRRNEVSWSFGCGPGFDAFPPGPGIGCGWSAEANPEEVWETSVVTNFQW